MFKHVLGMQPGHQVNSCRGTRRNMERERESIVEGRLWHGK